MKSEDILSRLAQKHLEDIFVPECKVGPSYGSGNVRMDAWAMARSWSKPLSICYEIKVSRSDFNGDKKWVEYLPYCQQFFFVVPHGMIKVEEVPEPAGLIYASENTSRLVVKKKAGHRDQELPESLYRYILMARTKIVHGYETRAQDQSALVYWRNWLATREIDYQFGKHLSKTIRTEIDKKIRDVEVHSKRVEEQNSKLEDIKKFLSELGVDYTRPYFARYDVKRELEILQAVINKHTMQALDDSLKTIKRAAQDFEIAVARVKREAEKSGERENVNYSPEIVFDVRRP